MSSSGLLRSAASRESLEALGAPHPYIAWLSAAEAASWLDAGRWQKCADRLRMALGSDPGAAADVLSRLVAARLSVQQGRVSESRSHLTRAEELFAETTDFLAFEFDAVRAMVLLAEGDPSGAVEAALRGATSSGAPPTMCEWLIPLAARGLADLADSARGRGEPADEVTGRLDSLLTHFPHVLHDSAVDSPFYSRQLAGLDAFYAAEVGRARRSPDRSARWTAAAAMLDGVLPWDAAYAAFRAAESQLVTGNANRDVAASQLRRAIRPGIRAARRTRPARGPTPGSCRTSPVGGGGPTPAAPAMPGNGNRPWGLTAREQAILEHIVAGRTYAEIARALFLSEKTVSSHVSNVLRKSGAANRVALARLAQHGHDAGT